jgi:[glutamine synthetase] adenylyltransferase / [glutamine synthetase]-adenylyl-L-tyrosine phosphorylase
MMLIKARAVAGDKSLAAEFIEMIQPFRYPRTLHEGVLREVAAVKDRIENEVVKTGELDRNVKLGRGGIREIEFIAQSQQLLLAGRQPFLQGPQTLPCLQKLAQYERLDKTVASALAAAYVFLRDVEHRLQMEENLQTHTIPTGKPAQERLARLMGFMTLREFEAARAKHCTLVRGTFERMLKPDSGAPAKTATLPKEFDSHTEPDWKRWLEQHRFRDVDKAYRMLREFVEGPGYVHISPRTSELASQLLLRFFSMCPGGEALRSVVPRATFSASGRKSSGPAVPTEEPIARSASAPLSDPDRVLTRLDSFISAYGARSTLFELWNATPAIFELLVLLFDRSEFLAELAIRTPDLVDELVTSERLRESKTSQQTLEDLRYGLKDADQHLWIRRYHQAELMRIGLRDILGLADFEQYLAELSALAEACLAYALEVVIQRHKLKAPPFAVIGLGKLGGAEIDYGSDLDVLFVADGKTKNLALLAKFAVELTDLLSTRTAQGAVFEVDARLRPDGEKGLLVNTLKAFEDYYRNRASLWEIQALSRTRLITGDPKCGAQFQNLAASLANFKSPSLPLSAATPDWKDTIHQMRLRVEKERSPSGKGDLAIKTGAGGLMDAEFIAQALAMEHGWHEPNTLRALERAQEQRLLPDSDVLISNYRWLRRVEGILRRWSYEGETVLPDDPAPFYRVSVRCGYTTPEEFSVAVARFRRVIREAYNRVFGVKA